MSDLRDATFLPGSPPSDAIIDYSHTLTVSQIARLESNAAQLSPAKAKVVILPTHFKATDFPEFAHDLGVAWHVSGNRMLMVIDLQGHHVQLLAGSNLTASGLDANNINRIIGSEFVPYMRSGDLYGAVSHTLTAVKAATKKGITTQGAPQNGYAPGDGNFFGTVPGILLGLAVIAAICGALYMAFSEQRNKHNKVLAKQFDERAGKLFEKADQIGSGSEFLSTEEHPELAQRVATFFNRMTAFDQAVREVQTFERQKQTWKVNDGYQKLLRMLALMEPEAAKLKEDVDAVTGGVQTYKEPTGPSLIEQAEQQDEGHTIKIPDKGEQSANFRRPAWTYEPAYYQPVDSGLTGMAMMMVMMNQMQMMNYGMHGGFGHMGGLNDYGTAGGDSGMWNSSGGSDFSSGGGGWGDSGADFSQGGGSWDSGDIGGGDSGGGDW